MKGKIVIEKNTGRRAIVTACNSDWQIEIFYLDSEGREIGGWAIAWTHPMNVAMEGDRND